MTCRAAVAHVMPESLPARLVEALSGLTNAAAAYMRYHAEKFYADSDVKPTGLAPQIETARAVLREAHGHALLGDGFTMSAGEQRLYLALLAILDYFAENHDPKDWPASVREADLLLHGRRA